MKAFVFLWILTALMATAAGKRPNILLVVSEDNGPELGCYGEPYVQTPVLDRLAAEGTRFERAYVPQAGCSQSRAALLTGLYPHQNGQIGLATWKFGLYEAQTANLVRSLKQSGYRTGIIGKLHINPASAFPFDFKAIPSANFGRKQLGEYAREASKFFTAGEEPFFLSVNVPDAHRPFTTQVDGIPANPLRAEDVKPLAYFGLDSHDLREQTANYYNCMARLDAMVGDLLKALDDSGKRDDTLIVYLGDHGADLLRGKRTSYEGGLRIPLILAGAGIDKPQVRSELVSTLDLMPTLLEIANAEPVSGLPGHSLTPLLMGKNVAWRQYLHTEFHTHSAHNYYPQRTVRDERYKLIQNLMPNEINPGYAVTNERFFQNLEAVITAAPEAVRGAYRRMQKPPEFELYDLKADPNEWVNLAQKPEHTNTRARLQKELQRWRQATNDPLLNPRNVSRLKAEMEASLKHGKLKKKDRLELHYQDYFFSQTDQGLEPPRNVLFIAIDDLRPALGCYDDEIALTPNIDALAARGTTFLRACCQQAVCSPSRLSLMTGRRPDTTRVWDLSTHFRQALPNVVTLPQHFKAHGYHTRSIGKIYHGGGPPSKDPPSWSEPPRYDNARAPEVRYATEENLKGHGLKRAATELADVPDDTYIDGIVCNTAIQALTESNRSEKPFFLAVGFRKPHLPFCAPKRYWDLYPRESIPAPATNSPPEGAPELGLRRWTELEGYTDIPSDGTLTALQTQQLRHGYYACVSYIDAQVGRLLDCLDKQGLRENTLICLWGDHGFHLGEQSLWTKANNYELSTRVPLIVAVPGQAHPGAKSRALVELVDLYPTLTDLCDLPMPSGLEGISFRPLLAQPDRPWKTAAFSQFPRHRTANRHRGRGDIMGYAVRTEHYRYVEWRDLQSPTIIARELYHHAKDPNESRNVAQQPSQATRLQQMQETLTQGWQTALPTP